MTEREVRRAFDEHQDAVYNFALRLTGDTGTAEDLAQECFLQLVRDRARFDPSRGTLRAFLLGVVRNLAHKHWRQAQRIDPLDEDLAGPEPDLTAGEVSQVVGAAVQSLAPLQREALILFEYEGLTLEEIASLTGSDTGTIKSRLHRARERLRRILAPLGNTCHR